VYLTADLTVPNALGLDAPLRAGVGELPTSSLAEVIRSSVEMFRRQTEADTLMRDGCEAVTRSS
jgi:hypothetical protein